MKKFLRYILTFLFLLCMNVNIFAVDFTIGDLGYTITSPSNLEVEVASCANIENVVVPETVNYKNRTYTVTGIGNSAFYNGSYAHTNLTNIQLPNSIKNIGWSAFFECKLESIKLPQNLQTIGSDAFYKTKIESVVIPATVKSIGNDAFRSCYSLMEVFFIGEKCPNIEGSNPFDGCHSALTLYVPNLENYKALDPKRVAEYISFSNNNFEYSGKAPSLEWSNNLKGYNAQLDNEEEAIKSMSKEVGEHTVNLAFTYSDGVDFTVEVPYTYTITQAPLSLTVNNAQREYGESNPTFTCSMTGFVADENAEKLGLSPKYECRANKLSNAGEYKILASVDAKNYEVSYNYGTLSVVKAPITVRVNDASCLYGESKSTFDFSYSGLKNGESSIIWKTTPTIQTEATAKSHCGTYTVSAKDGVAQNYEATQYLPGTLTINKRDVTAKVNDCERLYGEDNPAFNIKWTGFVNSENEEVLTEQPKLECVATKESNAGNYPIKIIGGSAEDYNIIGKEGTLKVLPLTVGFKNTDNTVTFNDMDKSSEKDYFYYIPEITGPYNPDDFYIEIWSNDKRGVVGNYVETIKSGKYAGSYFVYDGETGAGKYIYNLISKGTNPNVTANPAKAYATINSASNNLVWNDNNVISVEKGSSVALNLSYDADITCSFNTDYDKSVIELTAPKGKDGKWTITGLEEGETELSFGIVCDKTSYGYYNYIGSQTLYRTIRVTPATGIETAKSENATIEVRNGNIIVKNTVSDKPVKIFTIDGRLVYNGKDRCISGLESGIYVVKIDSISKKIVIE